MFIAFIAGRCTSVDLLVLMKSNKLNKSSIFISRPNLPCFSLKFMLLSYALIVYSDPRQLFTRYKSRAHNLIVNYFSKMSLSLQTFEHLYCHKGPTTFSRNLQNESFGNLPKCSATKHHEFEVFLLEIPRNVNEGPVATELGEGAPFLEGN